MTGYVCFTCGKEISDDTTKRKVRCPYCGGRVLYKRRSTTTSVSAR